MTHFNDAIRRVALVHRVTLAMVVLVAITAQMNLGQFRSASARWPETGDPVLSSKLATWDSAHYLVLSEEGYEAGSSSCAFFPLWPAAIHAVSFLTFGRPLVAGLLLANALSLAAICVFYRLVEQHFGEVTGQRALILLLAFPSAYFFSFPYTESLYLTMVLVFFWKLERNQHFWPCIVAFLMPLTKAIGVFVVLPLAWHLFEQKKPWRYWLLLLAPVLGYAAYFGVMYLNTGNAFEGFEAQKAYPYSPSIKNMFDCGGFYRALVNTHSLGGMMDSALDRFLFILFLALLPLVYRLNKTWFFYTLPAGLVPAMTSYFMSYRRYIMVCFPIFIVLAQLLTNTKSRWVFWYYVVLLAMLQIWGVTQFVTFNWAG